MCLYQKGGVLLQACTNPRCHHVNPGIRRTEQKQARLKQAQEIETRRLEEEARLLATAPAREKARVYRLANRDRINARTRARRAAGEGRSGREWQPCTAEECYAADSSAGFSGSEWE